MVTPIAGGPAPAAATAVAPVEPATRVAATEARKAAVSSHKDRDTGGGHENTRDAAYGVAADARTQEASEKYDARGKSEGREDRGRHVDKRA
ncbi:MAG: hypothetical protein COY40_02695 [Alphaproteobacteria bacterium CG_4_10_14_0_8_um_filter_53_9]|nr:MAG: hypothetical protein COY40_02695 [Alphaproteobacteria bacterium CG_4_10_14_0_8_um_filter_53_9]